MHFRLASAAVLLVALSSNVLVAADVSDAISKIRRVEPKGVGHKEAVAAARELCQADVAALPKVLAAMDGANEVATNWLRLAAEAIAQKAASKGQKLPIETLEAFMADTRHAPRGRRLAYELIAGVDPSAEQRLIPTLLDDPSLELRRDAVAQLLESIAKIEDKAEAAKRYQKALFHARDLDQIKSSSEKLKELGDTPDIAAHMGFVMTWRIIGPFDNVEDKGWDVAYPPETKIDFAAELDGQKGKVKWVTHATEDEYGLVDLNKVLATHKGAIAYAHAEFTADRAQPCEVRTGSVNAHKVWLNGKLIMANHVYHSGGEIDQYIARGELKKGKNEILIKVCQNEQTEPWAQIWQFQLRVCDKIGTAILSQDRPGQKVALLFNK